MSYVSAEPPHGDFRQPHDAVVVLQTGRLLDVTTYEEWRVTATPSVIEAEWIYSGNAIADPEEAARACASNIPRAWTVGPHLHKRTVTVTDWEEIDLWHCT